MCLTRLLLQKSCFVEGPDVIIPVDIKFQPVWCRWVNVEDVCLCLCVCSPVSNFHMHDDHVFVAHWNRYVYESIWLGYNSGSGSGSSLWHDTIVDFEYSMELTICVCGLSGFRIQCVPCLSCVTTYNCISLFETPCHCTPVRCLDWNRYEMLGRRQFRTVFSLVWFAVRAAMSLTP